MYPISTSVLKPDNFLLETYFELLVRYVILLVSLPQLK